MLPLLSGSVHKFRAGVAIRKDTLRGSQQQGNESFQPKFHCFHPVRDFLKRPSLLNVSGEKGNDSTGGYDGDGEPDDAPQRPAEAILFPLDSNET